MWLNIGCGPFPAPAPWVNTDVASNGATTPDVLVTHDDPFPFENDSAQRIYLGHVLEHVPWPKVGEFMDEVRRVLRPGGEVCVVGPDVFRTIERWHDGTETWEAITLQVEDDHDYQAWARGETPWEGMRHCWNAYEARIVRLLERHGFADVTPLPVTEHALTGWPVVAYTQTQCAVRAVSP